MFKTWDYFEKGKTTAYKKERQEKANERLLAFASQDPEMPYYGRDPKEIKRDSRYQNLSRKHKDIFNRFLDELWIHKGFLQYNLEYIVYCLELENENEAIEFLEACEMHLLTKQNAGCVYVPELREQYMRAVIKGAERMKAGKGKKDMAGIEDAF